MKRASWIVYDCQRVWTRRQAAELLGFQEHDIPVLVRAKLLHYLGKDLSPNSRKFFSSAELQGLADNREWLAKATQAVARTWQDPSRHARLEHVALAFAGLHPGGNRSLECDAGAGLSGDAA